MGFIIIFLTLILVFIIQASLLRSRISLSFVLRLPLRFFKNIKFMLVNRLVHQQSQHTTPLQSLSQSFIHRHLSCMEEEEQELSMSINSLPEDMLLEILARLPVKSLLQLRSVVKSCRDMVKEPFFITKHHLTQVALNNGNCVLTRAFINYKMEFALLTEDEQGIKCNSLELPFPFESPSWENSDEINLKVAGPCNGIVVISTGSDQLVLWNPATREYKALPPASLSSSWSDKLIRGCSNFGFGIDPITKDYKVVRIWNFYGCRNIDKAEVFSLSANSFRPKGESWKIIDDGPPSCLYFSCCDEAYLNGKYYWCLYGPTSKKEHRFRIVWFDMGAEVFGLIEVPNNLRELHGYWFRVFKESCLALVRYAYKVENKYMYQIWIMEEGGLSWTNYATVGPFLDIEAPLGFWKNEELVVYNSHLRESYFYNIKTHVKKIMMQGVIFDGRMPLAIYNESLVSVLGED